MKSRLQTILSYSAALCVAVAVTGFVWWPRSPADLGQAGSRNAGELIRRWQAGELIRRWQAGDIVALVRHTERCDRSSNPCSGPADGITDLGTQAAKALGQDFEQLGMAQVDVLTSPITRTAQTSHFMFGKEAITQDWLASCGKALPNEVVAHKRTHHNLLLVTHSGCISDFEAQTGFPHAKTSEYGSVLFVRVDSNGQLQVLGLVNTDGWPVVLKKTHAFK